MDLDICIDGNGACSLRNLETSPPRCTMESLPATSSLSPSSPLSPTLSSRSSAAASYYEDVLVAEDFKEHIDSFLRDALNSRNRMTVLRLELEIEKFVRNPKQQQLLLNPMPSSYERLAAHRVAQYYHVHSMALDGSTPSGSRILLVKSPESRVPSFKLVDIPCDSKPAHPLLEKFAIKQRTKEGLVDSKSPASGRETPVKSVEERLEEYNKARARIFSDGDVSSRSGEIGPKVDEPFAEREVIIGGDEREQHEEDIGSRAVNTVAEFRDREKDLRDPDYDRSYLRYSQSMKITSVSPSIAPAVSCSSINGPGLLSQGGYGQLQRQAVCAGSDNRTCMWMGVAGLPVMGYPTVLPSAVAPGFFSCSSDIYNCNQSSWHPRHYSYVDWREGPTKPCSMSSTDHAGLFQT